MSSRRRTYRRAESVLASDKIGARVGSIDTLRCEMASLLNNYMKVYDMHISFKVIEGDKYALRIDAKVGDVILPNSMD